MTRAPVTSKAMVTNLVTALLSNSAMLQTES